MGAAHGTDDEALTAVSEALLGIAGDLSMEAVLGQLAHAARHLAGARYAALGTPDGDGGFARWLTSGLTDDEIEAIGPLPRTHGVLGAMLAEPESHRTDDVRRDARFGGWWPAAHPEMQPFLAVPIVFRGEVVGAFYLANAEGGRQFDADDEACVRALAAHAAVLIEHARLYERTRELTLLDERNRLARELHDAMTQTMFSLRLTLETASALLNDDPAATGPVLADARTLVERAFEELRSLVFQLRPPALDDEGLAVSVAKYVDVAARSAGLRSAFDADDEARVRALAAHAAVLIEHARLYERTRELTLLDERNRLARELHDAMTQTMFSLRLTLETASALLDDDPAATGPVLADARTLVERAFEELRSLVFQLRPPALDDEGLAVSVAKYVDVAARSAGLRSAFDADDDLALPAAAESQVFRIVQEAVTNVLRHAGARSVAVSLKRRDGTVLATVADDGKGFDPEARSVAALHLGLTSMRERAEAIGGHLSINSVLGAGTTVSVEVPRD